MASRSTRSLINSLLGARRNLAGRLADRAGAAPGRAGSLSNARSNPRQHAAEHLERRILLAGDHPSLGNFPSATEVVLDGSGAGSQSGVIEPLGPGITEQNDLFRFTAPTQDFVALFADARASGLSLLNSRLSVFEDNGSGVAIQARDAFGTLIAPQSGNGSLSAGNPTDAWIGFVAEEGKTYYVLVGTDVTTGNGSNGAYTLWVQSGSTPLAINATSGEAVAGGTLARVGQDILYKITTGSDEAFNSLATFNGQAVRDTSPNLDVHLDIYNGLGVRIFSNNDSGILNDSFLAFQSSADTTYYVRVRSDEFLAARSAFALGDFNLAIDTLVNHIPVPIDPVTRRVAMPGAMAAGFHTQTIEFTAQGTGLTIIAMTPGGPPPPPILDGAISVYDETGTRIAFNDDRFGNIPQVEIELVGGRNYTILLDAFSEAPIPGVTFNLFIEAHHTNPTSTNPPPTDDHANTPDFDPNNPGDLGVLRNQFRQATPMAWGAPFLPLDQYNYYIQDTGWRTTAFATGRIQAAGDTDLFSFVPQVDMQSRYEGDNGDDGPSMFVGGSFTEAGRVTNDIAYVVNNVATYDANDWWTVGRGFNGTVRAFVEFDDDFDGEPSLFAGGDFTEFVNGEGEDPVPANHIAKLFYNPLTSRWEWAPVGNGVAFAVYSMHVYDAIDTGSGDPLPVLAIGGDRGLVLFDGAAFTDIGGANLNGIVHALTSYTNDADDPDGGGPAEDPPAVQRLVIGGTFTAIANFPGTTAANSANRLVEFDFDVGFIRFGPAATNGANQPVYALLSYDAAPLPNDGPDFQSGFLVGGNFTTIAGTNVTRFAYYTWDTKLTAQTYAFRGFGNVNGAVRAITLWDPIDPDGPGPYPDLAEQIVVGGEFTNIGGRVARYDWLGQAWNRIGNPLQVPNDGFNQNAGVGVRALAVMTDADDIGTVNGQPILYAGGGFTLADNAPANRGAQLVFNANLGDWVWASMGAGRDNGVNGVVHAMLPFLDADPAHWDHQQRPGSRLHLTVLPAFGPNLNTQITLYDSNFNVIYTNANVDSAPWSSQLPDGSAFPFDIGRSGMVDPNLALPLPELPDELAGIPVWGGRTYYLEVSGQFGSTGRYNIAISADAWVPDGPDRFLADPIDETNPAGGDVLSIPVTTGDVTNYLPLQTFPIAPRAAGTNILFMTKTGWNYYSDHGAIETIDDTDVYYFRAQASGFAQVRINTTNIIDEWYQDGPSISGLSETYSTDLDSYLRILDGDFSQIAFNKDNPFHTGEPAAPQAFGSLGNFIFQKRDASVTFPVEAGNFYYIIIGSGQKWIDATPEEPEDRVARPEDDINHRVATGGYQLLVKTMENLAAGVDDHSNSAALATPVPIAFDPASPGTNGRATVTGVVNNFNDVDFFTFNSPARGIGRISLTRPIGSPLVARLVVFDGTGNQVVNTTTPLSGPLNVQFNAPAGAQFFAAVVSEANTVGSYTLAFTMPPYADDHADDLDISGATTIKLFDYLGSGEAAGSIENPGDVDLFRFEISDFNLITVRVTNLSPNTLNPRVEIFELSTAIDDASAFTMWHRIAQNDDATPQTTDAQVTFSVTPHRTSLFTEQTYRWYYILVMDENRAAGVGNYRVSVSFPRTDDYPDAGEYVEAAAILIDPETGRATQEGVIELTGDTDLFFFVALAGGDANIVVDRAPGSLIIPRVTVIQLTPGEETIAQATGIDSIFGFQPADTAEFPVVRGGIYYVLIEPATDALGGYHISINSPPLDDYPNQGEWPIAHVIPINPNTGQGAIGVGVGGDPGNAKLFPEGDTDLFRFTPVRTGQVVVTITSYRGLFGNFAPIMTVFDVNLSQIGRVEATTIAGINDPRTVEINFPSLSSGAVYYILIDSVDGLAPPATRTGEYYLTVNGLPLDDGGGSDPGSIDFANPRTIPLSSRTGDGFLDDFVNEPGDRDLFTFVAPSTGKVFVQVVTPTGSILNAAVTLLRQPNEQPASIIFTDSAGIPGATANGSFDAVGGQQYWAIVSGVGAGVGSYRIRVDAEPETFYLYYPEGYASLLIREFVSVSNANDYDVRFTVKVRYEGSITGQPDETIVASNLVVKAGARGGVTISNAEQGPAPGVQLYRPYAVIVESDGPLGATFSHYDFQSTIGSEFSETLSASWTFARVERNPGAVFDFLLYYNPNPFDVSVLVMFNTGATTITIPQTIAANQRLGLSVNDIAALPTGIFGASVIASAANPANEQAFIGIVAALTHYDVAGTAGFGYLGDATGGSTRGAITSLTHGTAVAGELFIFNPSTIRATVTITGTYIAVNLPPLVRTLDVPSGSLLRFNGSALGITANQPIGLRYTSNTPVVLASDQVQNGDADASGAFTVAATRYFFGDAFINTAFAGSLYFETLSFHNPTAATAAISVTLIFTDSDTLSVNVNVAPRSFAQLKLHELSALVIDRPGLNFFSVVASASVPFVATMTHYDLYLQGGFTVSGAPLGLTNAISTIP
ncbi:MAG: hypothetical protein KF787_00785 [Phycisphaeraceae bacterium]|nr:hypothetical protein [Phycisphaerae bacterium]MBX3391158.1 hypothetical protein [Phycisphaeraceae bacterium]HRJ48883.1 hypothetical protein [Phycisphaerales bacterium]